MTPEPIGWSTQFHAIATLRDGSTRDLTQVASWASSDAAIATITSFPGSVRAVALGTATITATYRTVTSSATLTGTPAVLFQIIVMPEHATLVPGRTLAFAAIGRMSDGTTIVMPDVTWESTNPAVATIDATGVATGVSSGFTEIRARVADSSPTASLFVRSPSVRLTIPRDGALGVRTTTPIVITFDQAIAPESVTVQAQDGACSGTLQLSADDFATCHGFTGPVTFDAESMVATARPDGLTASTTWKISQVYGGGGEGGHGVPSFPADFVELHNTGASDITLDGFSLQYLGGDQTEWSTAPLPLVVVPGGGYVLLAFPPGPYLAMSQLPTPVVNTAGFRMSPTDGKLALTSTGQQLSGPCPIDLTNDFVGYGNVDCFQGTAPAGAHGYATDALRNDAGCADTDSNAEDFTVAAPAPRTSLSPRHACTCSPGVTERMPF